MGGAQRPGGRLVLVIDDDDGVRLLTKAIVEHMGLRAATASDGREGLECALRLGPDLLIVDQGLPLLDGAALIRRVRATPRGGRLPIIAVTGGGPLVEQEAARAGATVVVRKPFRTSSLMGHIHGLIAGHPVGAGQGDARPPARRAGAPGG
jgi:two-component system, chemotaxis family, sensor kinase CheA